MAQSSDTTLIEVIDLHPNEMELLKGLRNRFRYGEIVIIVKDGVPMRWKRITEFGEPGNP